MLSNHHKFPCNWCSVDRVEPTYEFGVLILFVNEYETVIYFVLLNVLICTNGINSVRSKKLLTLVLILLRCGRTDVKWVLQTWYIYFSSCSLVSSKMRFLLKVGSVHFRRFTKYHVWAHFQTPTGVEKKMHSGVLLTNFLDTWCYRWTPPPPAHTVVWSLIRSFM